MTMDAFSSHVPVETASEFITYRGVILKSRSCVCKSLLYMIHFALVFCSRGKNLHLDMTCSVEPHLDTWLAQARQEELTQVHGISGKDFSLRTPSFMPDD